MTNQGNAAIANVVVTDDNRARRATQAPVLQSGAFNVGDTDGDNLLDVGETWPTRRAHTVTQAELDAGARPSSTRRR